MEGGWGLAGGGGRFPRDLGAHHPLLSLTELHPPAGQRAPADAWADSSSALEYSAMVGGWQGTQKAGP